MARAAKLGDQIPFLIAVEFESLFFFFKSYGSRVDLSATEACARNMVVFNAVECGFLSAFHYEEDLVNRGNLSWKIVGLFQKV